MAFPGNEAGESHKSFGSVKGAGKGEPDQNGKLSLVTL